MATATGGGGGGGLNAGAGDAGANCSVWHPLAGRKASQFATVRRGEGLGLERLITVGRSAEAARLAVRTAGV